MEIFVKQLSYLNQTCKLSRNLEPTMTYTDFIVKIQPLMLPLVILINEAVTGPCTANQKILS